MKKIYSFLFAGVTVFAAASCQKEVDNNVQATPAEDTFTVTATVGLDTKTTLDENGKSTLWTAGDKISVFDMNPAGNNCCFEIATEDLPAATAEFKYTGTFIRPDVNENPDPFLVALYPYQSTALCDFASSYKITGISVPTEQVAKADGFDSAATFALAIGTESTKNDLKFNNLYSLLKFTVADEGVKSVTVAVNSEAKLAGEATVQLAVGQTGITGGALAATGSSSVTLECEEGFAVGETYYIVVAPVSYTSLTVSLDETVVKTVSTAKTLNANTIYNLGELTAPIPMAKINVLAKDVNWENVNMVIGSESTAMVETTIGNYTYFVAEVVANKTYDFVFNSGGTTNSHWKIECNDVAVNGDKYYRLSPKGAIEIDPDNESTFKYSIYVFDQKSKNVAPNLYVWNDNNAFSTSYTGWNYVWGGTAFSKDCYYKPADDNGWRHYYYIDIPTNLYNGTFSFIVNKKGQTGDIVIGAVTGKTDDIEIEKISSDLYVGYWFNDNDNNGFWTNSPMSVPITNLN